MNLDVERGALRSATGRAEKWKPLYRVAVGACVVTAVAIPAHVAAFVAWPPPLEGTVYDWFALFQASPLLGFVSMDLLLMLDYVLLVPIYVALFAALRRDSPGAAAVGTAMGLVAAATWFPSNPAVEILTLSGQHAAASTEAERALFAAAGQAAVASYQGTAFHASYVLGSTAGLLVSAAMLRSAAFGRLAGWTGIVGNVVGFGLYLPEVGLALGVLSGPILWVWYVLVARGFVRLGRATGG